MSKKFADVKLFNGDTVTIMEITGFHVSTANKKTATGPYDVILNLMVECCQVNGSKKDVNYFGSLMIDDYIKINEVINAVLNPVRQ